MEAVRALTTALPVCLVILTVQEEALITGFGTLAAVVHMGCIGTSMHADLGHGPAGSFLTSSRQLGAFSARAGQQQH